MRIYTVALATLLVYPFGATMAGGLVRNALTSGGTLASSYLTSSDYKRVVAVQDDASSFVASGGAIRGAYLEASFQKLRDQNPEMHVSDMDLAQAILAKNSSSAK